MKKYQYLLMSLSLACVSQQSRASDKYRAEIGVQRVFIPSVGFDDNDTVEAVLDGELPNSCFALEKTSIEVNGAEKLITVHQYATRVTAGICDPNLVSDMPQLLTPVPYSVTITIGQIASGDYQIKYWPTIYDQKSRAFNVEVAKLPSVDSLPYAKVTQVNVDDVIGAKENVKVELKGLLNNSCYELDRVDVQQLDDVTVLMPIVKINASPTCLMVLTPFVTRVDLGKLSAKHRMIHVRSAEGKSLNRTFLVRDNAVR